jgi:hypothetical protein
MSIFADLSLEEIELRAVAADLRQLTDSDLVANLEPWPRFPAHGGGCMRNGLPVLAGHLDFATRFPAPSRL